MRAIAVLTGTHVAFGAPDHATVDAFHAAALAAGGRDNGAPGLRPHYHPGYYGAFVLDPDGHNIEAVCRHSPDAGAAGVAVKFRHMPANTVNSCTCIFLKDA